MIKNLGLLDVGILDLYGFMGFLIMIRSLLIASQDTIGQLERDIRLCEKVGLGRSLALLSREVRLVSFRYLEFIDDHKLEFTHSLLMTRVKTKDDTVVHPKWFHLFQTFPPESPRDRSLWKEPGKLRLATGAADLRAQHHVGFHSKLGF